MTGQRPLTFLDVDGTIATLVDPANDFSDPRVAWVDDSATGVRYNPAVVNWIHELDAMAEVRWLTAWANSAATELAPALGLPVFAVVPFREHRFPELEWKHSAVLAQLIDEPTRPVLWLDDEIHYRGACNQLTTHALSTGVPFFAVQPTLSDGITEAHMLRIRAFLRPGRPAGLRCLIGEPGCGFRTHVRHDDPNV